MFDLSKPFGKITVGAFIPCFAAVVFNALNFIIENKGTKPLPPLSESIFDFSSGCAFAIVGIAVTCRKTDKVAKMFVVFCLLLLMILTTDIILPAILNWNKFWLIWLTNVVSFAALAWAIVEAG